ncbi:MAG: hypothetical protein AB7Q04_12720 [Steroidobacteraceae bacterium]
MSDAKVTDFLGQAFDCVEMTHPTLNHRDIGEICDHNISHHHPTYIRVNPQLRHLNTANGLDRFYRHFSVTHASHPHALTDRAPSVRPLPPFWQHIPHERNHP